MRKIVILTICLLLVGTSIAEDRPLIGLGDYNADVIRLHEKLVDLGLYGLRAESPWGPDSVEAVRVLQYVLGVEETGIIENQMQLDKLLTITINNDAENLATGTEESVVVAPSGENSWCLPSFYPTSESGFTQLADAGNKYFVVSFDWNATGLDTAVDATIELKDTDSHFNSIGRYSLTNRTGEGHSFILFLPSEGMRLYGSEWLVAGIGSGELNRGLQIELSNFKFARVQDWYTLP